MHRLAQHLAHHAARPIAPWQRGLLYGSGTTLLASGVVWLALHWTIGAGQGEMPHPLEAWLLRLHGAAAELALFSMGTIAAAHLPQGWRLSRRRRWAHQRASGLVLAGLMAVLAITGYALYYFAPEAVRPALGWTHAAAGLGMALMLAQHRRGAKRHPAHGRRRATDAVDATGAAD